MMKNLFCILSLLIVGLVDFCESTTPTELPVQSEIELVANDLKNPSVGDKYLNDIILLEIPKFVQVKYLAGHLFVSPYSKGFVKGRDEETEAFKKAFEVLYKKGMNDLVANPNCTVFFIVEDKKAIGMIWEDSIQQTDYFIHPSKAGKGYATVALFKYIQERLSQGKRVGISISPANIASLKVFAKVMNMLSDIVCTSLYDFSEHPAEISSADIKKIIDARFTEHIENGEEKLVTSVDCSSFSDILKTFVAMKSVSVLIARRTTRA